MLRDAFVFLADQAIQLTWIHPLDRLLEFEIVLAVVRLALAGAFLPTILLEEESHTML